MFIVHLPFKPIFWLIPGIQKSDFGWVPGFVTNIHHLTNCETEQGFVKQSDF